MKALTLKQLKDELAHKSPNELKELCLQLSRFKKDNKELLAYLLFESHNEESYIESVKNQMEVQFAEIKTKNYFFIRKAIRKILTQTKKYIRYSKKKETEVVLLLHFCRNLKEMKPSMQQSQRLENVFFSQIKMVTKAIEKLHEDLQYDYHIELEKLLENE
ncbi:MAG: hypothetical protein GW772_04840 [Flavobacteriia bacterium]|nr:hypothetical protein [Flavobacteriia bacterium]OIP47209.1 MAG: hypothetical protein AUK46_05705 [Flavobacteriaceae bacterium CG2_30_31_66]PIV96026.1 MAG: hypothetical protein COW43_10270 [Flavobacteriaceae bacterium CG17_big_fil_post_rev_8_21_14_2_50_31_13]PIX14261.1 MAG: hypothetical protein COZ74_03440 [Flavobacteriaceae bacterium CG_4_8_14_3_um_filter_31_8]PIY13938.1 MAG: hypothetical protein COZ16_11550 [Flavobacteriaceae bacterium CG_4_10_14_3_um_filter_31_253]PIZ10980.1 MAG: hypotheti